MLTIYQFNLQNKLGHATYLSKYFKKNEHLVSIHNTRKGKVIMIGGRGHHVARANIGIPLNGGESLSLQVWAKSVSIYAEPDQIISCIIEELEPQ